MKNSVKALFALVLIIVVVILFFMFRGITNSVGVKESSEADEDFCSGKRNELPKGYGENIYLLESLISIKTDQFNMNKISLVIQKDLIHGIVRIHFRKRKSKRAILWSGQSVGISGRKR